MADTVKHTSDVLTTPPKSVNGQYNSLSVS